MPSEKRHFAAKLQLPDHATSILNWLKINDFLILLGAGMDPASEAG
jgi:hypothetical protein